MIVNGDNDEYIRPIVEELKHKNVRMTYENVQYMLHTTFHPKRLNFIFNGLELIKTHDAAAPPAPAAVVAPAPAAVVAARIS